MKTFLAALALALLMEGIGFALFPNLVREGLRQMLELPDSGLRFLGTAALIAAILLAMLATSVTPA